MCLIYKVVQCRYRTLNPQPSNAPTIILTRHGKPSSQPSAWISGCNLGRWVEGFNQAGIEHAVAPDPVRQLAAQMRCIVASNLPRSIQSAACLAPLRDIQIDPDLREANLPESMGLTKLCNHLSLRVGI